MYFGAEMRRAGNATARLREYSLLGHNLWFANDPGNSADLVAQANWAWEDLTTFLETYMRPGDLGTQPGGQAAAPGKEDRRTVKAGMGAKPSGQ
jgi:hypothetical protein